ncbi:MAG: methyltransferase domain-containing protein [Candidatus Falkowbacteria bacterium]|nr:methyltransferase domain-containing protein [Candidatus Falkowbacteria bacterium]
MQYFFILGTNPTLSTAEICSVFPNEKISLAGKETAILETDKKILPQESIARIGGTIKIGEVLFPAKSLNFDNILKNLQPHLVQKETGKYNFGISYYGQKKVDLHGLAMAIKNFWREQNINSRWVTSKEKVLSSVVVEQNKLVSKGIEIVIMENNNELLIGKTLAVQPFKELSFRDYGRPARDDRSGMLPPKLAQIMINIALPTKLFEEFVMLERSDSISLLDQSDSIGRSAPSRMTNRNKVDAIILDPFCGSGTILSEALLMGYKNLIGSDISDKAVTDTQTNLKWIENNFNIKNAKYRLFKSNVQSLGQKIKASSVDAIITEPFLGPQRGQIDVHKIKAELEKVYSQALQEFIKVLKPKGKIVMVWPVFKTKPQDIVLNPSLNKLQIISPLPDNLAKQLYLTNRQTIIYGRPGQKVWREIVALKKTAS